MPRHDTALLDELNLLRAVHEEISWTPDLVPRPLPDPAIEGNEEIAADHIRALLERSPDFTRAEVISARKWKHGRRPVPALPLTERVTYRAAVNHLIDGLDLSTRSNEAFEAFERAPIDFDAKWVVMTDLANYYSSINLTRLGDELVSRTGRWRTVDFLTRFWVSVSSGYGGIPQVSQPSHLVSDIFADCLHRAIARRGLVAWRYADDFRIAAKTYGDAIRSLEIFDEEARVLGLFVNERKTLTPSIDRYKEMVNRHTERLRRTASRAREKLTKVETDIFYSVWEVPPEEAEVLREVAKELAPEWRAKLDDPSHDSTDLDDVRDIRDSLAILTALNDVSIVKHCLAIMREVPQLTPNVASYLKSVASEESEAVASSVLQCVKDITLTRWQHLWLLNVMEETTIPRGELHDWMKTMSSDRLETVRCQAIWSLALLDDLTIEIWRDVNEKRTGYSSPYLAASAEGIFLHDAESVGTSGDKIDGLVRRWACGKVVKFKF